MELRTQKSGRSIKRILYVVVPLFVIALLAAHEVGVRHFQDLSCGVCHEMKDPVAKWKESGTIKNHNNCAGCHFDSGIKGCWDMTTAALKEFVVHFRRNPNDPIKPAAEPLFLDETKQPAYWSYVPNSRCFQCKDAKNHQEKDQEQVHSKLIKDISRQPCKDCHSHEMHEGQKFYHKVLPEQQQVALKQ